MPPRPPLPQLYSPEEHPPAVPPLPRETTVIRHTSVRGLKRQSDERKRDREIGQYTNGDGKVHRVCVKFRHLSSTSTHFLISVCVSQVELRPFLSDPELMGAGDGSSHISVVVCGHDGYQTLPSRGTQMIGPVDWFRTDLFSCSMILLLTILSVLPNQEQCFNVCWVSLRSGWLLA